MGRDDLLWVFGLLLLTLFVSYQVLKWEVNTFPEESCNDGMTCMISLILVPQKKQFHCFNW